MPPTGPGTAPPDHLRVWLGVRATVPWHESRTLELPDGQGLVPVRDGAAEDIDGWDRERSAERAAAMTAALARARADAAGETPLGFALLSGWQRHVLGVPDAPFRSGPAYAKGGRERYGTGPDLPARLDACLGQSADPGVPLPARAARAYLDVCFFHPFEDGNARSAFLTSTFVLSRAGVALDRLGPLRRLPRGAGDPESALELADLIAVLINHSYRRALRAAAEAGSRPTPSCRGTARA